MILRAKNLLDAMLWQEVLRWVAISALVIVAQQAGRFSRHGDT